MEVDHQAENGRDLIRSCQPGRWQLATFLGRDASPSKHATKRARYGEHQRGKEENNEAAGKQSDKNLRQMDTRSCLY